MGLQGTAALVKACPKARQQRSIRSYAGASAGGTPRLVGTHGQAAAGSSSAEPAATDAASSSAADAPAAAAAAAAAAGSSSSAAAAAAAAGSSCTELAEVATGCTDLAEVIVSEPSTWMALGSPGPNDYTNYLWRLDLMEQALLRLGLKAKFCFEGPRSNAKEQRGSGSGSGNDRLRNEGPQRMEALQQAGLATTRAQLEADWWQTFLLASGQAAGVLDGSHRNWDSDNLFSTALVKLLTKLDVFFGSWELVNGKLDIQLWCAVAWAKAPTAEGGLGLRTDEDVLLLIRALCLVKSDFARFAQAGFGTGTVVPRLRILLTEFGPGRYYKGEYEDASPFEQVLALALHMRTTPFDGVGGGRTGNFAGSPGAALASYVHLHGPMYGPDGRPTTALPTGLDDEVLQPILKLLLETGGDKEVRLQKAAEETDKRAAQLVEDAKAALLRGGEEAAKAFPAAPQLLVDQLRKAAAAAAENAEEAAVFRTRRSLPSAQTAAVGLLVRAAGMGRQAAALAVGVPADRAAGYRPPGLQLVLAAADFSAPLARAVAEQRGLEQVCKTCAPSPDAAVELSSWVLGKLYGRHPAAVQHLEQACSAAKAQLSSLDPHKYVGSVAASILASTAGVTLTSAAAECSVTLIGPCETSKQLADWLPLLYSEGAAGAVEAARKAEGRPPCRVQSVQQLLQHARSILKGKLPSAAAFIDADFDAAQQAAADAALLRPGQSSGEGALGMNTKPESVAALWLTLRAAMQPTAALREVGNSGNGGEMQTRANRWPWLAAVFQRSEPAVQAVAQARAAAGKDAATASWTTAVELVAAVKREVEVHMPPLLPHMEPCLAAAEKVAASGSVKPDLKTLASTLAACLAVMALGLAAKPGDADYSYCHEVQPLFGGGANSYRLAALNENLHWLLGLFKPTAAAQQAARGFLDSKGLSLAPQMRSPAQLAAAVEQLLREKVPALLPHAAPSLEAAVAAADASLRFQSSPSTLAGCMAVMALQRAADPVAAADSRFCKQVVALFGGKEATYYGALQNSNNTWLLGEFAPGAAAQQAVQQELTSRGLPAVPGPKAPGGRKRKLPELTSEEAAAERKRQKMAKALAHAKRRLAEGSAAQRARRVAQGKPEFSSGETEPESSDSAFSDSE